MNQNNIYGIRKTNNTIKIYYCPKMSGKRTFQTITIENKPSNKIDLPKMKITNLYFIINPKSGSGKSQKLFTDTIEPVLMNSNVINYNVAYKLITFSILLFSRSNSLFKLLTLYNL